MCRALWHNAPSAEPRTWVGTTKQPATETAARSGVPPSLAEGLLSVRGQLYRRTIESSNKRAALFSDICACVAPRKRVAAPHQGLLTGTRASPRCRASPSWGANQPKAFNHNPTFRRVAAQDGAIHFWRKRRHGPCVPHNRLPPCSQVLHANCGPTASECPNTQLSAPAAPAQSAHRSAHDTHWGCIPHAHGRRG